MSRSFVSNCCRRSVGGDTRTLIVDAGVTSRAPLLGMVDGGSGGIDWLARESEDKPFERPSGIGSIGSLKGSDRPSGIGSMSPLLLLSRRKGGIDAKFVAESEEFVGDDEVWPKTGL
mmetsp:Transcript_7157/g.15137  ORF Transcript_7157/g.15137 Transcript_7157/m.15137 type:complete len:117 (+) Transcript_7157:135-485(+)